MHCSTFLDPLFIIIIQSPTTRANGAMLFTDWILVKEDLVMFYHDLLRCARVCQSPVAFGTMQPTAPSNVAQRKASVKSCQLTFMCSAFSPQISDMAISTSSAPRRSINISRSLNSCSVNLLSVIFTFSGVLLSVNAARL